MLFSKITTFILVLALYTCGIYSALRVSENIQEFQTVQNKSHPPSSQHQAVQGQHQSGLLSTKSEKQSIHSSSIDPSLVSGIAKAIEVAKSGAANINIAFGILGDGYAYRFNLSADGAALAVVDFQGTFVLAILPKDLRMNNLHAYYDFFLVKSKEKPGQNQLAVVVKNGNHEKVLYIAFKKDAGSNSAMIVEKTQDTFSITSNGFDYHHVGVHISTYRKNIKYSLHVTESRSSSHKMHDGLFDKAKLEMREDNKNNEPGPFHISVVKTNALASAAIKATIETVVH